MGRIGIQDILKLEPFHALDRVNAFQFVSYLKFICICKNERTVYLCCVVSTIYRLVSLAHSGSEIFDAD